jgi:hypothetical protein
VLWLDPTQTIHQLYDVAWCRVTTAWKHLRQAEQDVTIEQLCHAINFIGGLAQVCLHRLKVHRPRWRHTRPRSPRLQALNLEQYCRDMLNDDDVVGNTHTPELGPDLIEMFTSFRHEL